MLLIELFLNVKLSLGQVWCQQELGRTSLNEVGVFLMIDIVDEAQIENLLLDHVLCDQLGERRQ